MRRARVVDHAEHRSRGRRAHDRVGPAALEQHLQRDERDSGLGAVVGDRVAHWLAEHAAGGVDLVDRRRHGRCQRRRDAAERARLGRELADRQRAVPLACRLRVEAGAGSTTEDAHGADHDEEHDEGP